MSDFKFTDEDKSTAFVKFMAAEASPEAFLKMMNAKLAQQGSPLPFMPALATQANKAPSAAGAPVGVIVDQGD